MNIASSHAKYNADAVLRRGTPSTHWLRESCTIPVAMKLLRYGPVGREQAGMLDSHGIIRSLAHPPRDLGPEKTAPAGLPRLAAIDPSSLPAVPGSPRLGLPCIGTRKFIAIGLNYADHAAETNAPIPSEPVGFMKAVSCLQGPCDEVMIPRDSNKTDSEVELGVVIGTTAQYAEAEPR